MIDIRTNKRVNDKAVKFADNDAPLSYLAQTDGDDDDTVVGIFSGDGDCIGVIESEEVAVHLINALQYAIENEFWQED